MNHKHPHHPYKLGMHRTVRVRSVEFGFGLRVRVRIRSQGSGSNSVCRIRVRVRILLINLDGAESLDDGRRVFRRNIRGYRTTPKFVRVRVLLKVIRIFLEHF